MHSTIIKVKRQGNQFTPVSPAQRTLFNRFRNHLVEGAIAHIYLEEVNDNGTLLQLAKLHAMIRHLALFTGTTFQGMKLLVKKRAGLFLMINVDGVEHSHLKSFGDDCSKDDLSLAIQAAIEIGEELNYILN